MYETRLWSMRLIGGNSLNTLLLILMSITHSSSVICISSVLMSPYLCGTYMVVIGSIWVCQFMWQWKGIQIMRLIPRILHAVGWGIWCGSVLLSLKIMRQSSKMMNKISLMVQKFWSNLCWHGLTQTVLIAQTLTLHQCLLLKNCVSMDSASLPSW